VLPSSGGEQSFRHQRVPPSTRVLCSFRRLFVFTLVPFPDEVSLSFPLATAPINQHQATLSNKHPPINKHSRCDLDSVVRLLWSHANHSVNPCVRRYQRVVLLTARSAPTVPAKVRHAAGHVPHNPLVLVFSALFEGRRWARKQYRYKPRRSAFVNDAGRFPLVSPRLIFRRCKHHCGSFALLG
jgi:hypothetical protein